MKQKLLFLFLLTSIFYHSFAQVANTANDLVVCDDVQSDGLAVFDLTYNNQPILGSQSENNFSVTYHITQADADNFVNAIDFNFNLESFLM